jgi:hypothetical protein
VFTGESTTDKGELLVPYKIAITGHFRTGTDTFADMLAEALGPPIVKLPFADALKKELAEMVYAHIRPAYRDGLVTGYISQEAYRDGEAEFVTKMAADHHINGLGWQWWGEWRRQKTDLDYWIKHPRFQLKYQDALTSNANIIISDMCHINEAEWCRKEGFYLVRVEGPCRVEGERRDPSHASEVHIDELEIDLVLPNYGDLSTLKKLTEALPSHIVITHVPHFYLAKNDA